MHTIIEFTSGQSALMSEYSEMIHQSFSNKQLVMWLKAMLGINRAKAFITHIRKRPSEHKMELSCSLLYQCNRFIIQRLLGMRRVLMPYQLGKHPHYPPRILRMYAPWAPIQTFPWNGAQRRRCSPQSGQHGKTMRLEQRCRFIGNINIPRGYT